MTTCMVGTPLEIFNFLIIGSCDKGDMTCDASVDIEDALLLVTIMLGRHVPSDIQVWCADCNGTHCHGDSLLDVLDLVKIVRLILELDRCP